MANKIQVKWFVYLFSRNNFMSYSTFCKKLLSMTFGDTSPTKGLISSTKKIKMRVLFQN